MNKISIKGIAIGGLLDVVLTNILALPLSMYVVVSSNVLSLPKAQQGGAMIAAFHARPALLAIQYAIGVFCSILGGYVAARIAGRDELLNGALSSWLCIVSGIYGALSGTVHESIATTIFWFVISPVVSAAGGYLRLRQAVATPRTT